LGAMLDTGGYRFHKYGGLAGGREEQLFLTESCAEFLSRPKVL
jgi:hypothetical protein